MLFNQIKLKARISSLGFLILLLCYFAMIPSFAQTRAEFDQMKKLAARGDAAAQFKLGKMYDFGNGVKEDNTKAAFWYRKAAEQGIADAEFNLGILYGVGEGVPKDIIEAENWVKKAAEHGHARAQSIIGEAFEKRNKDIATALMWYLKSAEQGYPDAQFHLGILYIDGKGVTKDVAAAVSWLKKAAEQEHMRAQYYMGILYDNGEGVIKDVVTAASWYLKAAEQGDVDAQCFIGTMYEDGTGVTKDENEAAKWLQKAADQGDSRAFGSLSWHVLLIKGDIKQAEKDARTGIQADSSQIWIYANLGHALLLQSQFDAALEVYRTFLKEGDKDKAVKVLRDDFSELRKIYPDKSGLFDRTEKALW
jgi:TPR repeat protein